jgi:hypothetical protein
MTTVATVRLTLRSKPSHLRIAIDIELSSKPSLGWTKLLPVAQRLPDSST